MVIGYAMTAVCVPLMALAPALGGAGLFFGASMVLLERTGKAVRSPAKSVLLAVAAKDVGRGRGFGVHKALDQAGAFLGPLLVAGVVAVTTYQAAGLLVLAVPGAVALGVLAWMHRHVGDPRHENAGPGTRLEALPRTFYVYAVACALTTLGLMTFGVISFHLVHEHLVRLPSSRSCTPRRWQPMPWPRSAPASPTTASVRARCSPFRSWSPPCRRWCSPTASGLRSPGCCCGAPRPGSRTPRSRRWWPTWCRAARLATSYGVFAAFQAVAVLAGGALAGWLYDVDRDLLVGLIAGAQAIALALLVWVLTRGRSRRGRPTPPG